MPTDLDPLRRACADLARARSERDAMRAAILPPSESELLAIHTRCYLRARRVRRAASTLPARERAQVVRRVAKVSPAIARVLTLDAPPHATRPRVPVVARAVDPAPRAPRPKVRTLDAHAARARNLARYPLA